MTSTITCLASPAPGDRHGELDQERLAEARERIAAFLLVDQDELADELGGRWACVLDALLGEPLVTAATLRADLYYLIETLQRLRSALPARTRDGAL